VADPGESCCPTAPPTSCDNAGVKAAWAVLAALALLSGAPLAADDDDMTDLRIEVKTLGGKPIERASVIVRFSEGRSIAKLGKKVRTNWELRTSSEGVAKIPAIPKGKVLIQVIAKGYQTFGKEFEVTDDEQTLVINLNPPQPQYSVHQ
jgi:hypothetical protein